MNTSDFSTVTPDTVTDSDATPMQNILPDMRNIRLLNIDDAGRLRPVDTVAAEAIAASMARDGLLNPVDVCRLPGKTSFRLVAGGHRVAAARLLGWDSIPAFVRSADALDRKSREIAENVFRADPSPIDRSRFVAELYVIEKLRAGMPSDGDGRSFSANQRWKKQAKLEGSHATAMIAGAYSLQGEVAKKIGLSERSVRDDLMLFKRLSASMTERVRGLAIGSNATALRALAGLEPGDQVKVVEMIEAGRAKGVNDALAIVHKKAAPDAEKKRLSTFLGTFGRMGRKEKLAALTALEKQLPKGVRLAGLKESTMSEAEFQAQIKVAAE